MIDKLINRFRSNGTIDTNDQTHHIDIDSFDDDDMRDAAFKQRFRCQYCNVPNYQQDIYLIESGREAIPACESCLQANGKSEHVTESRLVPNAITGRLSYLIDEISEVETLRHRQKGDVEIKTTDENGDAHMGKFARRMIEGKYEHPEDNVWLGYYQKGNRMRELGMEYEQLFVHLYIQGTTGEGKSTMAYNILLQFAWSGFGFACLDPHGDLIDDVLEAVPPHRRDDVVIFDPTGDDDRKAALNILEIEKEPGDENYDQAVDAAVADVRSGMRQGGDWGKRMGPICDNLARGMIMHPDTYTFLDFQDILIDPDRRQQFADKIKEEGFHFWKYTQQIADMGELELSPLIRRLNAWTDSRTSRNIISNGESTFSFNEIMKENKLFLANLNIQDDAMQQMYSSAIVRRFARTAKLMPKDERTPFIALADEVDDIINEEMNLDDLLSNMRKFKFGMILMTQYIEKIDDRKVRESIRSLCNTTVTFRNPEGEFDKRSTSPSANLDQYHALVKLRIDGNTQGPYELNAFAPYPPRRSPAEARKWIRKPALKRCGVAPGSSNKSDETSSNDQETILKAIRDSSIIDGDSNGAVTLDDAMPRLLDRIDAEDIHPAKIEDLISEIPAGENGKIRRYEDSNGSIRLKTTPKGEKHIWQTGDGIQSGGLRHSQLLMDGYNPFTQLGVNVNIPDGSGSGPDATIKPDEYANTHPVIDKITDGSQTVIEAESATGDHAPGKTCANLAQACNNGSHCIMLARPDVAHKVYHTLTEPPYRSPKTAEGQNRLYNVRYLRIDGETMLRPDDASETVWIPEPTGDGYILRDSENVEHHRFGNAKAVFNDAGAYPHTIPNGSDVPDGWTRVKAPFIPDRAFDTTPDDNDWTIISVPHDAETPHDLNVIQGDHEIPLTDLHDWKERHKKDEIADSLRDILNDDE